MHRGFRDLRLLPAIETYLCQKNDGHLIRVVGPSFEMVSRWASDGVPLRVACGGIDRYPRALLSKRRCAAV